MNTPKASDIVSAEEAIKLINSLIETGVFSEYAQVCFIRAMSSLNREIELIEAEIEMAKVRERCGDD